MLKHIELSPQERGRLTEAISSFSRCHILVVGDLMLDTFIWGDVKRISPEAPVPVVEVREETQLLGGTANVVRNLATLGGKAAVVGTIGDDVPGRKLAELLEEIAVPTDGLVVEGGRPTTTKTRIIAQNQQVVRFDREWRKPLKRETLERILSYLRSNRAQVDALIISDYAKGMVSLELMDAVRSLRRDTQLPVIIDPKVRQVDLYRGMTMVTPNHHEASRMSGVEIENEETLIQAGRLLLRELDCEMLLMTRGKQGMSLFLHDDQTVHIPTVARRVYDVTGAGDTVLAAVTLGMAAGLSPVEAAILANIAAGIVVGEVGTAAVSAGQLLDAVSNST